MRSTNDDLHNEVRALRSISPVAVGTTGTGQTGKIIDRQGYGGVEFILGYGTVTATNATHVVTIKEGDVTSSMTSVADSDLLGTEILAGMGATASRVSGVSKNVDKRIGYKGGKRYVQANIKSTVTAGTIVHASAVLFNPSLGPTSNP